MRAQWLDLGVTQTMAGMHAEIGCAAGGYERDSRGMVGKECGAVGQ